MINIQNQQINKSTNQQINKSVLLTLLMVCFVSISVMAQNQPQPQPSNRTELQNANNPRISHISRIREDVLKSKMDYFKSNFKISDEKAEKFWLFFGEYLKAERKIHEETKKILEEKEIKKERGQIDFTKLNDEQIYFYYENQFKQKERLTENEQKFYRQIKEILSSQEIVEFYKLEKEFKNEVSNEFRQKIMMERERIQKIEVQELQKRPVQQE